MNAYLYQAVTKRLGLDGAPIESYRLNVQSDGPPTITITYYLTEELLEANDKA